MMRIPDRDGPVIWINRASSSLSLHPHGAKSFIDPSRLTVMSPASHKEALWCMEEALRSVSGYVVADLQHPADLTESRRLQLAAQAGGSTGLCLIGDVAISNAAETRWRSVPLPCTSDSTLQRWELIKNKKGISGSWDVSWDAAARSVIVVSAPGGGAGVAEEERAGPRTPIRCGRDAEKRLAALLAERGGAGVRAEARHGAG